MSEEDLLALSTIGVDKARRQLTAWLQTFIDRPDTESDLAITLCHLTKLREQEIQHFVHNLDSPVDVAVEDIIKCAVDDIEDACGRGGRAYYSVRVEGSVTSSRFQLEVPRPLEDGLDHLDFDDIEDELPAYGAASSIPSLVKIIEDLTRDLRLMARNYQRENRVLKREIVDLRGRIDVIGKPISLRSN